ncbi:MAG: HEAT repeat domain-containing protein [Gammaproteobacteria bacterium]|nr:HEAT repeat domain-containing protein [Gammaproteobacteria bacterium]
MPASPHALLLIATGCSHCPVMLERLTGLLKQGQLGRLELVNISQEPELAQQLRVRSVPWTRLGDYVFTEVLEMDFLTEFVAALTGDRGGLMYLRYLLEHRQLPQALAEVRRQPRLLAELLALLGDLQQPMALRIGIGALIEEISGEPGLLEQARQPLQQLLGAAEPQVRADACHYLGVLQDRQSLALIQPLLEDADAEVREIAAETLELFD